MGHYLTSWENLEQGGWRINVEEGAIRDTNTVHDCEENEFEQS